MTREPHVAGQFYENDFQQLEEQIKDCFFSKLGPGDLPVEKREGIIIAAIAPHAGYFFSGHCAAWVYKRIAESEMPDVFIMMGPSHMGYPTSISDDDWSTPFGIVKANKEFAKFLSEKTGIPINNGAHREEHSIEVQLPFLQFASKRFMEKLRIVPIAVSDDVDYKETAAKLRESIKESGKKVCIIVSSDFTHYGDNYGFVPFVYNIKENMYDLDKGAIDQIKTLDAGKFMAYTKKTGATICGAIPIAILMELLEVKAKHVHLLQYYTSGDVLGGKPENYKNAVGYAGIVFQ